MSSDSPSGVLLVTGAGRGIGAGIARMGASRGYAVCVNYGRSQIEAETLAHDIEAAGGRALAVQADVGDADQVAHLFATMNTALGPLTALVNNAGSLETRQPLEDMEPEFLGRIFAVNTFSCFYCAGQAIKRMSTAHGGKGGAIVNISSKAAVLGGLPGWSHYAASNGAIDSFTISLAREVGPQGIRVNAIRPGVIPTDIQKAATDVDFPAAARQTTSLGRMGTVEEVAEAALWLLSEQASYVHGIVLDVSGGR